LPPVGPGTSPDEFETKLVREIYSMPPGRPGYTTIKTIEENLRSRAGQLGGTRKEVPMRLERLEAMGLFKRETRPRGTGQVEVGELVMDHPLIPSLTEGASRTEARPQRPPRQPRAAAPRPAAADVATGVEAEFSPEGAETIEALPATVSIGEEITTAIVGPETGPAPIAVEARTETVEATPFRWVTSVGTAEARTDTAEPEAKAERAAAKPRKRAPRKAPSATTRTSSRSKKAAPAAKAKPEAAPDTEAAAVTAGEAESPSTEPTNDQTIPV
jgi:hypothetical protein